MESLIPLVNKLQETFASVGLSGFDLPQIAVVGSQSSGKSSVLENIVGKDFLPRGTGIVTRRPLVLQLIRDKQCTQDFAVFLHEPKKQYTNFADVRQEIARETDRLTGTNKNISAVPIYLKIHSARVIELTLVDLPGLTKVAVGDQPEDIEVQILNMVTSFVERESCLILAVSPANSDIANSDALQLARRVDPEGNRTIGVLTKLDLMDEGTDALDILLNKTYPLKHGFVGVVNRSQKDIESNKDVHSAVQKEKLWFSSHPKYESLGDKCGTTFLQEKLRVTLMSHIERHLPQLKQKLTQKMLSLESELDSINSPFTSLNAAFATDHPGQMPDMDDPVYQQSVLLNILRLFASSVKMMIDGHDGDLNNDVFNSLGHITGSVAPNSGEDMSSGPQVAELSASVRIKYVFQETYPLALIGLENRILSSYYDDEIKTLMHNVRGLRAGLFIPDSLIELLIKKLIKDFESPAMSCVDMVYGELLKMVKKLLQSEHSPIRMYPALLNWMLDATQQVLQDSLRPTQEEVKRLLAMEIGYLNTSHPDFIGQQGLGTWIADEKKKRAQMKKAGVLTTSNGSVFQSAHLEGQLEKLGGTRKTWKKRYFAIKDGSLRFFESQSDKVAKGEFSLANCLIKDYETDELLPASEAEGITSLRSMSMDEISNDKQHLFEIFHNGEETLFRNHKSLLLNAASSEEKKEWIEALSNSILYLKQQEDAKAAQSEPSSPVDSGKGGSNVVQQSQKKKKAPPVPPPLKSKNLRPPTPASKPQPGVISELPDKIFASDLAKTKVRLNTSAYAPEVELLDTDADSSMSSSDENTIALVRILVHSYIRIVRKHLQDLVPKAIMYLMVNKVKRDLPTILMNRVLVGKDGNGVQVTADKLLAESSDVKSERVQKAKTLKMLKDAVKIINTEVQASLINTQ
ncbi:hypothetical protein MIR68_011447 [Amoeboaphelidium protococcarum]|nr:hypothetical protein MIR68_011447 [Amoeboaphelidium protococcarum]